MGSQRVGHDLATEHPITCRHHIALKLQVPVSTPDLPMSGNKYPPFFLLESYYTGYY